MSTVVTLPENELEFSYARSGGPGGQNVNKVNSKAVLRWNVAESQSIRADIKERFLKKYAKRLTLEGDLIITSQKFRDQTRNVEDCLHKLTEMLTSVTFVAAKRVATRPSKAVKERRLDSKRKTAVKKQQRRFTDD